MAVRAVRRPMSRPLYVVALLDGVDVLETEIRRALAAHGSDFDAAAATLGVSRIELERWLRALESRPGRRR